MELVRKVKMPKHAARYSDHTYRWGKKGVERDTSKTKIKKERMQDYNERPMHSTLKAKNRVTLLCSTSIYGTPTIKLVVDSSTCAVLSFPCQHPYAVATFI